MASQTPGRVPALLAASAFALGIALAGALHVDPGVLARAAALLGLPLLAPAAVNLMVARTSGGRRNRPRRVRLTDTALLIALCLSGTSLYATRHGTVSGEDVALLALGQPVVLECSVTETRDSSSGRVSVVAGVRAIREPPPAGADAAARGDARLGHGTNAATSDTTAPVPAERALTGSVWASWPDDSPRPRRGDVVLLAGELSVPRGRRNPGAFDFAAYLRNRGVHRVLKRCKPTVIARTRGPGAAADWVERTIRHRVPGQAADVMLALLLGRSGALPDELVAAFRRSGTVHVLAVSGLHVGFVVLIVHALLRCARVPPRAARVFVLPFLLGFALLVGPRPSVVRACAMASLFLLASVTERRTNPFNLLGAAGLGLLAARPGALFDVGFQLSFSAVAGILALFEPLRRLVGRSFGRLEKRARRVADALALSLSAQLGVAPVLVATFGELSLAASVSNVVAVPLAAVSVASGAATLATAAAGPWPSSLFAACSWLSATALSTAARCAGSWTWAALPIASRFWPAVLSGSASAALALRARSRPARRAALALAVAAAVAAALLTFTGPGRSHARIVFFDVGQGDAALLELPGRRYLLIDAGPGPSLPGRARWEPGRGPDAGRRVIVPYLKRQGIRRLDAVVVTHAHADHFGGAAAVIHDVGSDALFLPPGGPRDPELAGLVRAAEDAGCEVREVSRGDTIRADGAALAVLAPDENWRARGLSDNDGSIVLAGVLNGTRILFTGDIEADAEALLCASGDTLVAHVLKVPHHGASTSSGRAFLSRVRPALAVVSVGEGNRYGHPHPDALARLQESGAALLRTDTEGAVLVVPVEGTATVSTVTGGTRLRS